jgi:hypothetical protein
MKVARRQSAVIEAVKLRRRTPHWEIGPHVRPIEISDADWNEIRKHSGLPPQARSEIGSIIAFYTASQRAFSRPPNATKKKLEQARKAASELRLILREFVDESFLVDVATHNALASARIGWPASIAPDQQLQATPHLLKQRQHDLWLMEQWFADAQNRIAKGSSGAKQKASSIFLLVCDLDETLEQYTGKTISRSNNRNERDCVAYVSAACRIADPTIGRGSIKEAIVKRIKQRRDGRVKEEAAFIAKFKEEMMRDWIKERGGINC